MPEILIGAVLIGIFAQKVLLPFLTQLKENVIALFLNWIFDVILSIVLISIAWLVIYIHKRKLERLECERLASRLYWKKVREEEAKEKAAEAYLLPKPKVLPPFSDGTSMWKEDEPEKQIEVNVDLDNPFYKRKRLNKHEIEYLIEEGYQEISYKSVLTRKKENYIVKPRFNESPTHLVVIFDLAEYLLSKDVDYELFMTRMPDIVLRFNRKRVGLEIETGTVLSNMKKFREKLDLLNRNFEDDWYFIVTNRNKVKKYKKYGKVIDPRYIKGQIDKIIEKYRK